MIAKIKYSAMSVAIASIGLLTVVVPIIAAPHAGAVNAIQNACQSDPSATICQNSSNNNFGTVIGTIINVLLFVIGVISVIMIIVGGFTYATSAGDSGKVGKAKNTILYAVVGLIVAFLAYAVVNYVLHIFHA